MSVYYYNFIIINIKNVLSSVPCNRDINFETASCYKTVLIKLLSVLVLVLKVPSSCFQPFEPIGVRPNAPPRVNDVCTEYSSIDIVSSSFKVLRRA